MPISFLFVTNMENRKMPGRKRVPTHLKLLMGNPGKRPLNKNEPVPAGDLLHAPEWFTADQVAGWTYAIANAPKGLLKRLDRSVLTVWVVAENLHRQATLGVEASGLITESATQGLPMQNPYLPIINRQGVIMMKAASELGFSPTARARVSMGEASQDENEYNEF